MTFRSDAAAPGARGRRRAHRAMVWPAAARLHDATCRCGAHAVLATLGENFYGGECTRCGPILAIDHSTNDELVRRAHAGLGREPRRGWLHAVIRLVRNLFRRAT